MLDEDEIARAVLARREEIRRSWRDTPAALEQLALAEQRLAEEEALLPPDVLTAALARVDQM